ncbi:MAG: hypothetical protein NWS46_02270 [Cyclobacteriaceae bacterium]|jgi:hypothetical protein|nr:hypothetical protein [Cyclobacteriaceae bacterium]
MRRKFIIILLLGLVYFTGTTLIDAGSFKTVINQFDGQVVKVYDSVVGPEDLDIDRERGLLYISSSDR